jgi:hypothetical protein
MEEDAYSPIVPFAASFSSGPNVSPLSSLTLITGTSLVSLVSHHVITTLSASESISTLVESASVVLLRFTLSPNVTPLSVDALNNTSSLPVLFVHHATRKLSILAIED